jgi:hypothetical protein
MARDDRATQRKPELDFEAISTDRYPSSEFHGSWVARSCRAMTIFFEWAWKY